MTEIIGVRFRNGGKIYFFSPGGLTVEPEQPVIVETARGVEFGVCAQRNTMVEQSAITEPLRPVLRIATEEDCKMMEANRKKEARAFEICQQKIVKHGLDMKLVDVEYNFEGSKILFFFTSDGRVDFRELVKDLASVFRTRIELRQIGVRDEAKMLGGLGICGQPFCCTRFLEEFQPVSIKMAKTQNLSLNPAKISGTCGRLMCCLKYEQEAYEDLLKRSPRPESFVDTPDGVGTVSTVNLLREQVKVRLDIAPETPRCYKNNEICVIRSGKGKRPEGYDSPEELLAAHIRQASTQAVVQDADEVPEEEWPEEDLPPREPASSERGQSQQSQQNQQNQQSQQNQRSQQNQQNQQHRPRQQRQGGGGGGQKPRETKAEGDKEPKPERKNVRYRTRNNAKRPGQPPAGNHEKPPAMK